MAPLNKVLLLLTLLFLAVDAKYKNKKDKKNSVFHKIPKFPKFPVPIIGGDQKVVVDGGNNAIAKPDFETNNLGHWELINKQSGVSAMQINLMPNNKIVVYMMPPFTVSLDSHIQKGCHVFNGMMITLS